MDLEGITLSEIRENKYQYCIISLICEIPLQTKKKKKEKETEAIERIDWWLPEAVGEMREGGQKLQMSNSKISYGDVMYCIVSIVNNTVLHTRKFLRDCFFNLLLLILH